ncbi:acetyl-CoA C-acetyltransferase [Gammaproteobacteria bacterium]|nr:acetyl-CoA C-acetyltransferase [Gammaproteobacteria bacterium]
MKQSVYVVDGSRTPFLRAKGRPGEFSAAELAIKAATPLLLRQNFSAEKLDEVIMGCVMPAANETNIARVVALRLGCGDKVPAWTVQRNCASGLQALDTAARHIADGDADLILAGGIEAMSRAPLMLNLEMVNWFSDLNMAKTPLKKLGVIAKLRPRHLQPVISLLLGLTDPVIGLSMGKTAEILAYRFGISRTEMDAFALQSHQRLAQAQQEQKLDEIEVIYDQKGKSYAHDDGVRPESDMESLAKLKAVFDRPHGLVTAGNSAQVTDGASCLLLASESAVQKYKLPTMGKIIDCTWSGLSPAQMGLGPAYAIAALLQRNELGIADIDQWEINEAFAAQVLACLRALEDDTFCQEELGLDTALGSIDPTKLNVDGGGISLGHPVGASGARVALHVLKTMKKTNSRRGIASLCIGGGQGGAMLLENANG